MREAYSELSSFDFGSCRIKMSGFEPPYCYKIGSVRGQGESNYLDCAAQRKGKRLSMCAVALLL